MIYVNKVYNMPVNMTSLPTLLRVNASSCIFFGAVFASAPNTVARFVGATGAAFFFTTLGVLLLVNGAHLLMASMRSRVIAVEVYYFSVGDLLWVTATLALLGADALITSRAGIAASILVATLVGALGVLQLRAIAPPVAIGDQDQHLPLSLSIAGAIAGSWRSMKTGVKVWLFALNTCFLGCLAFWPDPLVGMTLAAYLASGPWLVALMVHQRGLTRLLGIAHLIPWSPLLVYLWLRLISDRFGPELSFAATPALFVYVVALLLLLVICLALDLVDVWRWFRGERYWLGSIGAQHCGASTLA